MDKAEVIILLSILPVLIFVFIKHDEFMALFLIEIAFVVVIGLMYAGITVFTLALWGWIEKLLNWISDRLGVD